MPESPDDNPEQQYVDPIGLYLMYFAYVHTWSQATEADEMVLGQEQEMKDLLKPETDLQDINTALEAVGIQPINYGTEYEEWARSWIAAGMQQAIEELSGPGDPIHPN